MKNLFLAAPSILACLAAVAAGNDTRCFEMRTYYAAPGKLKEVHARFRDHANRLLEKHGITVIGHWVPLEEKDGSQNTLTWVLACPSREARDARFKALMDDPDWQAAYKASEANGKLVEKVESRFLEATDYSPAIKPAVSGEPRVFELRTYTAAPGKLDDLNARFRNHTVKLFEQHGMQNVAYWVPMKGQPGADDTLIYILAHKSRDAAKESFSAFGQDPVWQAARKASEEKAGGSLTVKDGVKSVFMAATDYSPTR